MYCVLWALRLYIGSNVSRSLGIVSVYRVKCVASFGNCVCLSRQMYGVLWELRLYIESNVYGVLWELRLFIASNVRRPLGIAPVYRVKCIGVLCKLGIASVYRIKCIVSFGQCDCISLKLVQQLSVYPVECLHGEGGCGGVSTRIHHLQLGLVSRHPLRALGGLQLLPYPGKPWRERGIHIEIATDQTV